MNRVVFQKIRLGNKKGKELKVANVKITKVKHLTKLKNKSKKREVFVAWLNPSLIPILCNKRPIAQEEKMCKALEQTIPINTVGQCACGECSSVFKNVRSNKRPNKY